MPTGLQEPKQGGFETSLATDLQHFKATYSNSVGRNMLRAFGHPVTTFCDMLGIGNLTSEHRCTDLAKRLELYATSTNLNIFKLDPTTPNSSQQGGQTHATCCSQ